MAPSMLEANLAIIKRNPTPYSKGDFANKLNRRLAQEAAKIAAVAVNPNNPTPITLPQPLTREEEVCACTYAQHVPNLDMLAEFNRLKNLMEEDLLLRNQNKGVKKDAKPTEQNKVPPLGARIKKAPGKPQPPKNK